MESRAARDRNSAARVRRGLGSGLMVCTVDEVVPARKFIEAPETILCLRQGCVCPVGAGLSSRVWTGSVVSGIVPSLTWTS